MRHILGIDIGGTKSAASVGTSDGQILARASAPTPAHEDADAVVALLVRLVGEATEQASQTLGKSPELGGIGVSAGAPADAARGLIFNAPNLPVWGSDGFPIAWALSDALSDGALPAFVENDADATCVAEHKFGAGVGANTMLFLTIGTGIGAGLILDGRLHRGASGAGGEIGHIAVVPGGRLCKCGLRGCLEAYASGPSIARIAAERGFHGEPTGQGVITAARVGDEIAHQVVRDAAEHLGRGIASAIMLLNPDVVVLGTLAVHAGDLLLPTIRETVRQNTWPRLHENLQIVPAALGDRAQDVAALCAFLVNHRPE